MDDGLKPILQHVYTKSSKKFSMCSSAITLVIHIKTQHRRGLYNMHTQSLEFLVDDVWIGVILAELMPLALYGGASAIEC